VNLKYATPSEIGINETWLMRFLSRLEQQCLPMHSCIIMRHGKICLEAYYNPYDESSLHRMFSVTKSLVALAIGALIDEGRLSLDDKIVDYFPEKQPVGGAFPYTAMMTIRDMLEMKTCHAKTTYKVPGVTDWVGSFFTTPPSHVPGTSFAYDTSSTHVLSALVEKLTGMTVLDYMRRICLSELGFSAQAHILTDPSGIGSGGSGLCATTRDLLILMMLVAGNGCVDGRQYISAEYVMDARRKHSDPYANQGTWEEMQGYGYQIWLTRHSGNVLFGMGGQLALYLPDEDIFMITTADTQGRQGGVQLIYDAFFEEIYDKLTGVPTYATPTCSLSQFVSTRRIVAPLGDATSPFEKIVNRQTYICDKNSGGFVTVRLDIDEDRRHGSITFGREGKQDNVIEFSLPDTREDSALPNSGLSETHKFPGYGYRYIADAAWRMENYLLIKVNIIDSEVGNLYIGLNYKDSFVTVVLRKVLEYKLDEYSGVFSAKLTSCPCIQCVLP
jgi:CubicO group peptidase (beta-lactamase class C family)